MTSFIENCTKNKVTYSYNNEEITRRRWRRGRIQKTHESVGGSTSTLSCLWWWLHGCTQVKMPQILYFITCIYFTVSWCVGVHVCHSTRVRLEINLWEPVSSLLVPYRFQGLNRGRQAGWQVPLSTQPSCLPVRVHPLGIHHLLQCHSCSSIAVRRHHGQGNEEKIWGLLTGSEGESVTIMARDWETSRHGLSSTWEFTSAPQTPGRENDTHRDWHELLEPQS